MRLQFSAFASYACYGGLKKLQSIWGLGTIGFNAKGIFCMAHWRDSARNVRFFIIDYRATFPLLILIFHIRVWTFVFAVITTLFFALLERWGFTVGVFLRWVRAYIAGPRKIAQPWWKN